MSIAVANTTRSRKDSSSFLPRRRHILLLLLLGPFVIRVGALSWFAFPATQTCAHHLHDGRRALCQSLAALDVATPHAESNSGGEKQVPLYSRRRSRYEDDGGPNLHRYADEPSLELELLLGAYSRMHFACNSLERANLSIESTKPQVQCKYLIWSCTFGLGNQLMSLVSAFLFSILSQRVLLLDNPTWDHLFSEPFPGSTWLAPAGFTFKEIETPTTAEFHGLSCGSSGAGFVDERCQTNVVSVVISQVPSMEDQQLLVCPSSFLALRDITFLNLKNSNQYFAVGLFLNPAFRPLLELLFPQRNVFHALSRFLLLPSNTVWDKIRTLDQKLLNASRRIGVQLRESKGDYRHYFDDAIPLCIKSKSKMCAIEAEEDDRVPSAEFVSVYVSSLIGGHFTKLQEKMPQLEAETKLRFVLHSQPADGEQIDDVVHQQKALVDIWLLSLSDILLTTHMSTFGYTAHALAGITPFHLKHWLDNPCQLSLSNDPCYQFAPKKVACPRDHFVLQDPLLEVPYVKACPDIQDTGLQLQEP